MRVSRQTDSVVHVSSVSDPVSQALAEARAIALDPHLPPEVADRVLPSMCRLALEAAYQDTARVPCARPEAGNATSRSGSPGQGPSPALRPSRWACGATRPAMCWTPSPATTAHGPGS